MSTAVRRSVTSDEAQLPRQRLDRGEDIGSATALVLIIDSRREYLALRLRGYACVRAAACCSRRDTLAGRAGVVRPVVNLEHVPSIACTKAAFCSGGMQKRFTLPGLDLVFLNPAGRCSRSPFRTPLAPRELVGQQRNRPPGSPLGRRTTRNPNQLRTSDAPSSFRGREGFSSAPFAPRLPRLRVRSNACVRVPP